MSEVRLSSLSISEVIHKANIDPYLIDEVIIGNAKQTSIPSNMARYAMLEAELPAEIPAYTVQRHSASGLQAIVNGYYNIKSEQANVILAGGAESTSMIPREIQNARFSFNDETEFVMNPIAEQIAEAQPERITLAEIQRRLTDSYNLTVQELEAYSRDSLAKAQCKSNQAPKLVNIEVKNKKGSIVVTEDELYTEQEEIAGYADAAAACLLADEETCRQHHWPMLAEIMSVGISAGDPGAEGLIGLEAVQQALMKAKLTLCQIDCIQILELTAAQALVAQKELGKSGELDPAKVNSNGGSLATGNSWGAAGAILVDNILTELDTSEKKYGLILNAAEGGQVIALIVKRQEAGI
jgi:acetyl-CoA C-acetyltransferase